LQTKKLVRMEVFQFLSLTLSFKRQKKLCLWIKLSSNDPLNQSLHFGLHLLQHCLEQLILKLILIMMSINFSESIEIQMSINKINKRN